MYQRFNHKITKHNFNTYFDILSGINDCVDIFISANMDNHLKSIQNELKIREESYIQFMKNDEEKQIIQEKNYCKSNLKY